jgi:hypothetical protein
MILVTAEMRMRDYVSAIVDICGQDWPKTEGYDVRTRRKNGAYSLGPNFAHLTGRMAVNPG